MKKLLSTLFLCGHLAAQPFEPLTCEEQYQLTMESDFTTPSEKILAEYSYRVCGTKLLSELEAFSVADGVDSFEAWLLACLYFEKYIGLCGVQHVPSNEESDWVIRIAHQDSGVAAPPSGSMPTRAMSVANGIRTSPIQCQPSGRSLRGWLKRCV